MRTWGDVLKVLVVFLVARGVAGLLGWLGGGDTDGIVSDVALLVAVAALLWKEED